MWTMETVDLNEQDRRRAGWFVQSGRTSFFLVPVLQTSTTGRTVTFLGLPGPNPTRSPPLLSVPQGLRHWQRRHT